MKKNWREIQHGFFKESIEFVQDQRILDFFSDSKQTPTYGYGDISYFKNKINIIDNLQTYVQALLIFNFLVEKEDLLIVLDNLKKKLKNNSKVSISINKFLLYSNTGDKNTNDDYDQSLKVLIENQFKQSQINYYFVKNLKGESFNFASPTTQFFFLYKK